VGSLIIIVALFALLWLLLIRPQRKRQMDQQRLLSSIDLGDEVLTVGGLYGIVREIDEEDDLIVEIAEGIQVRIARRAVGGVVKPEGEHDGTDEDEDDVVEAEEVVEEAEGEGGDVAEVVGEEGGAAAANEGSVVIGEETVSEEDPRQA